MKNMVSLRVPAKINIGLNVVGISGSLHVVDTAVKKIDIYDEVTLTKRSDGEFTVGYADGLRFENDNALKAARAFSEWFGECGADIFIKKNIPVGAGLGGSSADMVGVLKGLENLYGKRGLIDIEKLLFLGSDVPCMYFEGDYRVRGRGDKLEKVVLPRLYALIICPIKGVDTKRAYEDYDVIGGEACDLDGVLKALFQKREDFGIINSLERAAALQNPQIAEAKEFLIKTGFKDVFMTGSGSAVCGIMKEKIEEGAKIAAIQRGYAGFLTE